MAAAARAFQWLNILEKELDNTFVDVDLLLNNVDDVEDDTVDNLRAKMSSLCSIFAQMAHKAQTIFENNAKLEALNVNLRRDLESAEADKKVQKEENMLLIEQIHCMQLRLHGIDEGTTDSEDILRRLTAEVEARGDRVMPIAQLEASVAVLKAENVDLKQYVLALQTEMYGARLAAKYLDKELAGRIQQIQLLGNKIKGADYKQLWSTLESEISLQRQKTVIRACKGPEGVQKASREPPLSTFNNIRQVTVRKAAAENLGMSVTGGKEHGVPLLISEVYPGQLAARTGQLFVGDAILSVNGVNLRTMRHVDAVKTLCQPMEDVVLEVMYISNHDKDDREDSSVYVADNGYRYRLYQHPAIQGINNLDQGRLSQNSEARVPDSRG